eukprot:SM000222S06982  [mRNA]  locus=s222:104396:107528:+ [translate_table: standard]
MGNSRSAGPLEDNYSHTVQGTGPHFPAAAGRPPPSYSHHQPQQQEGDAASQATLRRRISERYRSIPDKYTSLEQVQQALREAGLESSNLVVGIDFTKSNEWTGKNSFNGRSLHAVGGEPNPYEQALAIIGRTLSPFDDDNLIPCFGFGDVTTHDQDVFSFYPNGRVAHGFEEALARYRAIVPHLKLSGPTSFAPIVEAAVRIVEQSGGQYHVVVIIADGQVTRSVDVASNQLSPQEEATIKAIVAASLYPLSIILVGVGDGPWDTMQQFDDHLPARSFDNFQFVNFTQLMARHGTHEQKEARFAVAALMEIPLQYKALLELNILGRPTGRAPPRTPLPPPATVLQADAAMATVPHAPNFGVPPPSVHAGAGAGAGSFQHSVPPQGPYGAPPAAAGFGLATGAPLHKQPSGPGSLNCPVCFDNTKDLAFQCGHQTCQDCGKDLKSCPICRAQIQQRFRLYS